MQRLIPLALSCAALAACVQYNEGAIADPRPAAPKPAAQELVDARQAGMTMMVFTLATLSRVAEGEGPVKAATFPASGLEKFGKALPGLFREDTAAISGTEAKPEIWTAKYEFDTRAAQFRRAATNLREAAASDNRAAYVSALADVKASCQSCHDAYRAE